MANNAITGDLSLGNESEISGELAGDLGRTKLLEQAEANGTPIKDQETVSYEGQDSQGQLRDFLVELLPKPLDTYGKGLVVIALEEHEVTVRGQNGKMITGMVTDRDNLVGVQARSPEGVVKILTDSPEYEGQTRGLPGRIRETTEGMPIVGKFNPLNN